MGLSADFIAGFCGTVVLTIIGFLVSRVFSQTDENFKEVFRCIEHLRERAEDCDSKHDLAQERAKHISERLASLEEKHRQ